MTLHKQVTVKTYFISHHDYPYFLSILRRGARRSF
jgi:hypothetical protein